MKKEGGREAGYCGIGYRTVAIDVCLLFNVVVFSATYFRFLFVKLN
jgi:hypothetical protein